MANSSRMSLKARLEQSRQNQKNAEFLAQEQRRLAAASEDSYGKQIAELSADELSARAESEKRKGDKLETEKAAGPVKKLGAHAPRSEIRAARRYSAVQVGDGLWLPCTPNLAVAIPNDWIRSALFGTGAAGAVVANFPISCANSDITMLYTGILPGGTERAVYAAALSYYADRQLQDTIKTSVRDIAKRAGLAQGSTTKETVVGALRVLSTGGLLVVGKGGAELSLPKLLQYAVVPAADLNGDPVVTLNAEPQLAQLYGREQWTAITLDTIYERHQLRSWTAVHYESHAKPCWLSLDYLMDISRFGREPRFFRRELRAVLEDLKGAKTPLHQRIAAFHFARNARGQEFAWVCREAWEYVADARAAAKAAGQDPLAVDIQPPNGPDSEPFSAPDAAPGALADDDALDGTCWHVTEPA